MNSRFYHVQINIDFNKNYQFYKELMKFLGWQIIFANEGTAGYKSKSGDIWFIDSQKKEMGDFDKTGLNHIAIRVQKQKNVDEVVEFLKSKDISPSFGSPRHRSEFNSNKGETYYQVIFLTPDNIQIEVVYIGLKS